MSCVLPHCSNFATHQVLAENTETRDRVILFVCKDHFNQMAKTMKREVREKAK